MGPVETLIKKQRPNNFQEGTPWVFQILNNAIVSMVAYCAQKLLGRFFLDLKGKSFESRVTSIKILT